MMAGSDGPAAVAGTCPMMGTGGMLRPGEMGADATAEKASKAIATLVSERRRKSLRVPDWAVRQ